jgi:hypothetical protein
MSLRVPKKILVGSIVLLTVSVFILAVIIFTPSQAPAEPTINWTPSSVNQTILAGKTQRLSVSFTASENVSNVNVRVVPELVPYVQASPAVFANIAKGQPVTLGLTISSPATSLPGIFQGTIQLKNGTGANAKTFARPLPVEVDIVWQTFTDTTTNVSFALPPVLASIASITSEQTTDGSVIDVKLASKIDGVQTSQFSIGLDTNSDHLGLETWFRKNIDPDGSLLSTGVYALETFAGGMEALVQQKPLPADDQIAPIFGISPTKSAIITLSQSQINDLESYGYTTVSSQISLLLTILQTINVP